MKNCSYSMLQLTWQNVGELSSMSIVAK